MPWTHLLGHTCVPIGGRDGFLALSAYECLMTLFQAISAEHNPSVDAVAKKLANGGTMHRKQLVMYAKSCVLQPMLTFEANLRGIFS